MNNSDDFVLNFLARKLKVSVNGLLNILEIPSELRYTKKQLAKKHGKGHRTIYQPKDVNLKKIQRRIHRWMKKKFFKNIKGMYGFGLGPETGSYAYARNNKDWRWFFSFDIKDAFPSVGVNRLQRIIGKLCHNEFGFYRYPDENATKLAELIIDITTVADSTGKLIIPQGAPTSSFLFWLFLVERPYSKEASIMELLYQETKKRMGEIFPGNSIEFNWRLSCYVDNFLVGSFDQIPDILQRNLIDIFKKFNLEIHKIRYQDIRCGSPRLCGWHIREDGRKKSIIMPPKKMKKWRGIIHQLSCNSGDPELRRRVKGFLDSIRPVYGKNLPRQLAIPLDKLKQPRLF